MKIIAKIITDFPAKFGVPRQPGLADGLIGRIVFEPEYRNPDAIRGLKDFSHLWVIWEFSENVRDTWSPTIRPPRLGGNVRVGVFATRSSFRPNPIAMSALKIVSIEPDTADGPVITVSGVDMVSGTPIYDIKPYVAYTDSIPDAISGFASDAPERKPVKIPDELIVRIPEDKREGLVGVLALDPRPGYHNDPTRVYGFEYSSHEIRFRVCSDAVIVVDII